MRGIPFTKLHGLGNDFVLIDAREGRRGSGFVGGRKAIVRALTHRLIRAIADRKRGVGFDQLLVLKSSRRVHAILEIYNADASKAEMCGNGLRAAALYLWTRGGVRDPLLVIETAAGDRSSRALDSRGTDALIECDMGVPRIKMPPRALKSGVRLGDKRERPVCLNIGNPHAVIFAWPRTAAQLSKWGSTLENHRAFPRRTNVEFVRVKGRHVIEVKVWERGVGITEACGTGAVAAAVAAIERGLARSPVEVRFPGGRAEVSWEGKKACLRATAHEAFTGVFFARG